MEIIISSVFYISRGTGTGIRLIRRKSRSNSTGRHHLPDSAWLTGPIRTSQHKILLCDWTNLYFINDV